MPKEPKRLDELFHDTLKDIFFAERRSSPRCQRWRRLRNRLIYERPSKKHRGETETHIARLEKVFAAIDKKLQAKTYEALVGITDEGAEIMKDYKDSPALDAGLLAAAQAVDTMRCHVTTRSRPGRRNSA